MKQLINLSVMLFTSAVIFAQTSVKPSLPSLKSNPSVAISSITENDDYKAQIDALVKQNANLKKQLAAMLNPSQAELNSKFITAMEESNKILSQYFKKPQTIQTNNLSPVSSFSAIQTLGDFKRISKDANNRIIKTFVFHEDAYIAINNESLVNDGKITEEGISLIKSISELLNKNDNLKLIVERNELTSLKPKAIEDANDQVKLIAKELRKIIKNGEERISISQYFETNKVGKNSENLNPENYNFIISQ